MAVEVVRIGYTRLFEVRLLHHFWLDEDATTFDAIPSAALKAHRLLTYDVRRFLSVRPNATTAAAVAGLRGVFRMTGLGFVVAVPDEAVIPLDSTWEFFVTATGAAYSGYTALSLRPRTVAAVADPDNPERSLRYMANVPVLSNLTGDSQGTGPGKRLFLSQPYLAGADAGDGVEALVTSGNDLRQLTGDPPAAPFHVLGRKDQHPVYVHQGDVRAIVSPPGTSGVPARGIEMARDTPPNVVMVLRLTPQRADDEAFGFANPDGTPRAPTRIFEVHLRNRWTFWRYRSKSTGAVTSTEANPLPLTRFGNAGTKRKPSVADVGVELDPGNPSKISRLVSDIHV